MRYENEFTEILKGLLVLRTPRTKASNFYCNVSSISSSPPSTKKKKVVVHCVQGISRSVSILIVYVIFVYRYDFNKAEAFVK